MCMHSYVYIISYKDIYVFFISLDPGRRKFVPADGHRPRLSTTPLDSDAAFDCWCLPHSSIGAYGLGWSRGWGG